MFQLRLEHEGAFQLRLRVKFVGYMYMGASGSKPRGVNNNRRNPPREPYAVRHARAFDYKDEYDRLKRNWETASRLNRSNEPRLRMEMNKAKKRYYKYVENAGLRGTVPNLY